MKECLRHRTDELVSEREGNWANNESFLLPYLFIWAATKIYGADFGRFSHL